MVANPLDGGALSKKPRITPGETRQILELAPDCGYDRKAIAEAVGIPLYRLNNIIDKGHVPGWRDAKAAWDAANGPESKPSRRFADILRVQAPQFADPIPYGEGGRKKWRHAVAYGDTHKPFADDRAVRAIRGIIKDVQPDVLLHIGDLVDCFTISDFNKDPARKESLQDEIDQGAGHLHQDAQLAPNARRILVEGNHEGRLTKTIWKLQGAQRELAKLRVFQQAMTWPNLLGLDQIGWEFVPTQQQPLAGVVSKLVVKHGTVVRKWSSWSAKGEWEKHAKGGISGHTHRLGAFYHRDLAGSHVWHETGCSCSLQPDYVQHPDWQHGCAVIAYTDERYHVEPVYIENGRAIWRGKEFAA